MLKSDVRVLRRERAQNREPSSVVLRTDDIQLADLPSTRYQGSKRKIVPWIWSHLKEIDFSSALDVFGGTGSVSYLLKRMGKRVTYNDYLHFNYQIGLALIENDKVALDQSDIDTVLAPLAQPTHHFVRDTFRGIYFTDAENKWIDRVVTRIKSVPESRGSAYKQSLLYYALFQSCLIKRPFNLFHRRNLYLRLADVEREFGNKTTWDKPFRKHFTDFCTEVNGLVFEGRQPCNAICYSALEIPDQHYDLVYIDPPYLRPDRWNDSYLNHYHFLEGLCRYDSWRELIDYTSPHLRIRDACPNIWMDRAWRTEALDALLEKFAASTIVVSYKRFGVPSISALIKILKRHRRKVRSYSQHYKYALNHQNGQAHFNREVLLIAE